MSTSRQLVDALIALLLGAAVLLALNAVAPPLGTRFGLVIACAFYFSRNPWGSPDGYRFNDRVDGLYDAYLPFDTA